MKSPIQPDRVFHGDSIEGMKRISQCSVDLVITDPPFGIEFKAKKRITTEKVREFSKVQRNP